MSEKDRDEIDEVLSKYLPSNAAPSENDGRAEADEDAAEHAQDQPRQDSEDLTSGLFAWIKSNLIFLVAAALLLWSLVTIFSG